MFRSLLHELQLIVLGAQPSRVITPWSASDRILRHPVSVTFFAHYVHVHLVKDGILVEHRGADFLVLGVVLSSDAADVHTGIHLVTRSATQICRSLQASQRIQRITIPQRQLLIILHIADEMYVAQVLQ